MVDKLKMSDEDIIAAVNPRPPAVIPDAAPKGARSTAVPATRNAQAGMGLFDVSNKIAPGAPLPFGAGRSESGAVIPDVSGTSTLVQGPMTWQPGKPGTSPTVDMSKTPRTGLFTPPNDMSLTPRTGTFDTGGTGGSGSGSGAGSPARQPQPVIKYDLSGKQPTTDYGASVTPEQRAKFASQPAGKISPGPFQTGPAIPEGGPGKPGEVGFSGGTPLPADYTTEMQAKDVEARKDAGRVAMGDYMNTLDQANANERIHGQDMARQVQAFKDRFGVDLKSRDFQAKLAELGMQAPKYAAETKLVEAQTRKADAEAAGVSGKEKDDYSEILGNMISETMKNMVYQTPEEQQKSRDNIEFWATEVKNRSSKKNGKKEVDKQIGYAKMSPDQKSGVKQSIKQKLDSGQATKDQLEQELRARGWSESEITESMGV